MTKIKRVIRKLGQAEEKGFDAQFWPVVVALCVLTSFVLGAVLTLFRGPMLWLSLMLMPAGLAASIIVLASISHRRVRRTLQLAIILSMIMHIVFILSAYRVDVFDRWLAQSNSRTQRNTPQTIQIPVEIEERPWEQVNITETPEIEPVIPEVEPEQTQPTPERPQPTPVEREFEQVQPQQIERNNPSRTTPQFNQQQSRLSRSEQNQRLRTSANAEQVNEQQSASNTSSNESRNTEVARTENTSDAQRETNEAPESQQVVENQLTRQPAESETSPTPEPQREVTRRENPRSAPQVEIETQAIVENTPANENTTQPQADSSTQQVAENNPRPQRISPTPNPEINPRAERPELPAETQSALAQTEQPRPNRRPRETNDPAITPTPSDVANNQRRNPNQANAPDTAVQVDVSPQRESTAQTNNQPTENSADLARTRTNPNQNARRSVDPTESNSIAIEPSNTRNNNATRQPRAEDNSQIARSESPTNRARTQSEITPSPQTQVIEVESDSSTVQATELAANPTSNDVTRQPTQNPSTERQQNSLPETNAGIATQIPRVSPNSQPESTQPSVETNQNTDRQRRSIASSDIAQTPTNAESPTSAQATDGNQLTMSPPEQFAVDRSSNGVAGVGESRNLDRDVAANERPAIAPSNSANRPQTTTSEPGQSFQPSESAQVRQSIAGELVPSANLNAEIDPGIGIPASNEIANNSAQSSATPIESRSPSTPGDVSALRGTSSIDVGPPKIVRNELNGRGAGGGQSEPTAQNSDAQTDRNDRGSLQNSIAANTQAELPASPREDGNTGNIEVRENPNAESLARSSASGGDPVEGGPTNTDLTGPTDLASTSPELDSDSLVRADSRDAMVDDSAPGGGDDDEEDEEERERRRRLARSGGGDVGQLALDTNVDIPSGSSGELTVDPTAIAGSVEAGDDAPERVATSDGSTGSVERSTTDGDVASSDTGVGSVEIPRGEISDGIEGSEAPGGGTSDPRRRSTPIASISGDIDVESITGLTPGTDDGAPASGLQASDAEATRIAGTTEGIIRSSIGAVASQLAGPSIIALPPVILGPTGQPREPGTGETAGEPNAAAGGSSRRDATDGPQINTQVEIDLAGGPGNGTNPSETGESGSIGDGLSPGESDSLQRNRNSGGGIEIDIAADDGPGGLGAEVSPQVGIDDRRARIDAGPIQAFSDARFVRDDAGGVPTFNPTVTLPSDAFRSRQPLGGGRGSPQTEEAIEMGLAFLSRHQQPEGHWKLETFGSGTGDDNDETPIFRSDAAATGLALLAFQGAGYNHIEYKYAAQLDRAITWMVENQDDDGCLYVTSDDESNKYSRLYSHGIAALALCEAYGMTGDPELRPAAQLALDYIVASQDKQRGGWRYTPGRASDTSVSGWMMMALKSGEFAGLDVPQSSYDLFERWLDRAQIRDNPHQYAYNPFAQNTPERRHGLEASRSMTSVAMLMRLYMGWDKERQELLDGTDYLLEQLPSENTSLERDTYYWYYATQIIRHMGGERWATWNDKLHPLLLSSQVREPRRFRNDPLAGPDEVVEDNSLVGSWDPLNPIPDAWGLPGGRIYVTTLNLLSLEVDYRLMPLYQNTVDE